MPHNRYRAIPAVHEIVNAIPLEAWRTRLPREQIVSTARKVIEMLREELTMPENGCNIRTVNDLATQVAMQLDMTEATWLRSVINATGIIIHTGLGRAPLAQAAVEALLAASQAYVPLEINLQDGRRGDRLRGVRELLCDLTGAEAATVVNNNAAGLVIALACLARDREVIVSRGELIEIGGEFRLPEIMAASGTRLREVGTTNKTKLADYESAISESTGAILKVHPSNFQQSGFVESVTITVLAKLAKSRGLPLIHDIGSGALVDLVEYGLQHEPVASESITSGSNIVLFSGDKLLGGPQAGIVVGNREWIQQVERHPLMRALRVDKLIIAALRATLQLHLDKDRRKRHIPVICMMTTSLDELMRRAKAVVQQLVSLNQIAVEAIESTAYMGGGALPRQGIASAALRVRPLHCTEADFALRLRAGSPPVVPHIQHGAVLLDMRTVFPADDDKLVAAIFSAARGT